MKANLKTWLVISIFSLVIVASAAGKTIYVDADAAGSNDGASWTDAYNNLQDALAAASSGDEIWVAGGIYKPDRGRGIRPGDRIATFKLKNGVAVYGGFPSGGGKFEDSNPSVYETILSGDLKGDDAEAAGPANLPDEPTRAENSYHVVTGSGTDATAVLDGFIITAGNGGKSKGGGLYNSSGSPTISNCTFISNLARCGGAIYNEKNSNPTLINCTFSGNSAKCCGGGVRNQDSKPTLDNCTFTDNWAGHGGAMRNLYSSPTLTDCTFRANSTPSSGAAVYNECSEPTFTNCTFTANRAQGSGGAMNNCTSDPNLVNCIFTRNTAQKHGGALHNCVHGSKPILINCTLSANSAEYHGGGIYSHTRSSPTLTNCILWANVDRNGTNELAQIHGMHATVNYCCTQGWTGDFGGIGNIGLEPLFVDMDNDNYHLQPGSSCIDAGDNMAVPSSVDVDLDGKPRFIDGNGDGIAIVDMGVYELGR